MVVGTVLVFTSIRACVLFFHKQSSTNRNCDQNNDAVLPTLFMAYNNVVQYYPGIIMHAINNSIGE